MISMLSQIIVKVPLSKLFRIDKHKIKALSWLARIGNSIDNAEWNIIQKNSTSNKNCVEIQFNKNSYSLGVTTINYNIKYSTHQPIHWFNFDTYESTSRSTRGSHIDFGLDFKCGPLLGTHK